VDSNLQNDWSDPLSIQRLDCQKEKGMKAVDRNWEGSMQLELKLLRLKTPVHVGSYFGGDWKVSWLGGWTRDHFTFIVMVARVKV
jgi:hypothetical protein